MTDLEKFLLMNMPMAGATAAELEVLAEGFWGRATLVRGLNRLCRETPALARLVSGEGSDRRWAPTEGGVMALSFIRTPEPSSCTHSQGHTQPLGSGQEAAE